MKKDPVYLVALLLVVVGGLNWGLVGLLNFNLVTALTGFMPLLEQVVYILVGLAAIYVGALSLSKYR
jgi:uncharacterized protein